MGNDIVDLKTPEALGKSRDARFVEKVLTKEEARKLKESDYSDRLLWAFWAAKEAAYKAAVNSVPGISSAPRTYAVTLAERDPSGTIPGWVRTPLGKISVMLEGNADYVHARAGFGPPEALERLISGVGRIPEGGPAGSLSASERESLAARTLATASMARFLGVDENAISIIRPGSNRRKLPPEVRVHGKKHAINLSLSHDGRFAAFAFYHHREHGDHRGGESRK